jgi:perosamine synthetase|tara:strand:- start:3267 stop:4412 length:1146 start_codon:yes stop_codon:yes gene_type:complete
MSKKIFLSEPRFCGNEKKYLNDCIDSGWVSSAGDYVNQFEESIAKYTGVKHAIAMVSGTASIHLSLKIAGVHSGHEVIAPTLTFIAPINAISYLGAEPVFMDSDSVFNLDIEKTIDFLKTRVKYKNGQNINKDTGNIIKAIVPVHIFGTTIDLAELVSICKDRGIAVIEDASESLGSFIGADRVHSGTMGDIGCISFNGNKIITCGGGGMILTDSDEFARQARYLSTQAKDDTFFFLHNEVGFNYRLTNIQAALGQAQFENFSSIKSAKEKIHNFYDKLFSASDNIELISPDKNIESNYWLNVIKFSNKDLQKQATQKFLSADIEVRPIWHANHLQEPFKNAYTFKIEHAPMQIESSLCLPSSVGLSATELDRIAKVVKSL